MKFVSKMVRRSRRLHRCIDMVGGYTLGHDARLMPARYVRPYSKRQKNHFRGAEAIAEAAQRPTMKFVTTKAVDQLDLQLLHRVRERLVTQRTGIINQVRAFFAGTRYCGPTGATLFADGVAAHPGHATMPTLEARI